MTPTTENNLRIFMRQCQIFWSQQWFINRNRQPQQFSYEQSLIGTYADLKNSVINKPHVHFATEGDIITEADCCRVFCTEFSDSWQDAKKHYCPGTIIPHKIIPNGSSIFKSAGMEGLRQAISNS